MVRLVSQALVRGFGAVSGNTWQAAPRSTNALVCFYARVRRQGTRLRFCWKFAENGLVSLGLECAYRIPMKLE
jgi:hypothetical protein